MTRDSLGKEGKREREKRFVRLTTHRECLAIDRFRRTYRSYFLLLNEKSGSHMKKAGALCAIKNSETFRVRHVCLSAPANR